MIRFFYPLLFLSVFCSLVTVVTPMAIYAASNGKTSSPCNRLFTYQNHPYPMDSSHKMDGEGLRFVLKKNAKSEALLNEYQSRLRTSTWPAYVGGLGLALLIGGPIYAGRLENPIAQEDTRNVSFFSGIGLLVGSYLYGQYLVYKKENTLNKAIESYNAASPHSEKIRIGVSPTSNGSGAQIQTEVPF